MIKSVTRSSLHIFTWFFFIFLLLLLGTRVALVFCYSGELGGLDNNFPYPVMRLLKGLSIYPAPDDYPFALNPYAPILFYLTYGVCWLFHIGPGDTIQLYFATRSVCLLCDLTTLFFLYRIMRRHLQVSVPVARIALLCFFYLISYWGFTMGRSDSLVLLCFAAIVFQLLTFLTKPTPGRAVFIAVLCTVSIFSKQSGMITPVIAGALMLYQKNWKALLVFSVSFVVLFAGTLSLLMHADPYFLDHLAKALNNRLDPQWYYVTIFKGMIESFAIVPLAIGTFMALRWVGRNRPDTITYFSLIALLVTGWSACIAIKWGSHLGYFHDSFFCFTAILAASAERLPHPSQLRTIGLSLVFVLLFVFSHILLQLFFFHLNDYQADKVHYQQQKEVADELYHELSGKDEYVFAYTNHYKDFFKSLLQEKGVAPNLDIIDCCAYPDKNFDYSTFREGFTNGRIRFILFPSRGVQTQFQDISLDHYKMYKKINGYVVYRFAEPDQP